ncbi:hypothetical protein B0H11DRAFT_2251474 [Mycena galericulata]|nr:hypothetical protein B0H11DRAFT_2251474 [Mycena galericulata]
MPISDLLVNDHRGRSAVRYPFKLQPYDKPFKSSTPSNFRSELAAHLPRVQYREAFDIVYRAEVLPHEACAILGAPSVEYNDLAWSELAPTEPASSPAPELAPTEPASSPAPELAPTEPASSPAPELAPTEPASSPHRELSLLTHFRQPPEPTK